jgi:hypothetical protein
MLYPAELRAHDQDSTPLRFASNILVLQNHCIIKAVSCPVSAAGSTGRCNTIWYKAAFKRRVYNTRETVGLSAAQKSECGSGTVLV